ncbi:hypothetical protein B0H14DRAFT_3501703 [Mycena olivaceomarginata]|nr:hypothetical protein B0H14DRAFT_3501703 [Mycena olivaceomarginata]
MMLHTATAPALLAAHPVLPPAVPAYVRLAGRATPPLRHHAGVGPPARCAPTPHQRPCRPPTDAMLRQAQGEVFALLILCWYHIPLPTTQYSSGESGEQPLSCATRGTDPAPPHLPVQNVSRVWLQTKLHDKP